MKLSEDIIVVSDENNSNCVIIYNKYTNSTISVHELIYDYLRKCQEENNFTCLHEDLSEEQIAALMESNVIYESFDDYLQNKYHRKHKKFPKEIYSAYIHPTLRCNLSCSYCYQRDNIGQLKDLPFTSWLKIIDELNRAGVKRLTVTGGEPLLYDRLEKILEYAKQYGMQLTLLSNGMLLCDKAETLKFVDKFIISLDSIDACERNGLDAEQVLNNIFWLSTIRPSDITVRSVVKRGYEEKAERLGVLLGEKNIPHIKTICMPFSEGEIDNIPDYRKYNLLDQDCMNSECGAGNVIIAVDPVGNVFPCQVLMKKEFYITNILKKTWAEEYAMNNINDKINSFNPYGDETCIKCDFIHLCMGACGANTFNVYGRFDKRPDFLCDFLRESGRKCLAHAK